MKTPIPYVIPHTYNFSQALSHLLSVNKMTQKHLAGIIDAHSPDISAAKTGSKLLARHFVPAIAKATDSDEASLDAAWERSYAARPAARRPGRKKRAKMLVPSRAVVKPKGPFKPKGPTVVVGKTTTTWFEFDSTHPKRGQYVWAVNASWPEHKQILQSTGEPGEFPRYTHWTEVAEPEF